MTRRFDAVELELLWRRLISLVDEAAAALVRASFSTLVREVPDFSCVVTDARGKSLVQATESIPSFIGTLPETVKHFIRYFPPEKLQPGDVLITNDLWMGTGHLPDITVAKPIFLDGRLVAFSASTAHAPDIGGKIRSPEPREVFEEGLQIPPLKLMRAGVTDDTLVAMLRQNVRTPGPDARRSLGAGGGAGPDGGSPPRHDAAGGTARPHRPRCGNPGQLRTRHARGHRGAA